MNRIKNIEHMEKIFEKIESALKAHDIPRLKYLKPKINELISYYQSDVWLEDFKLDEEGFFPENLKRGILSEDGIYNLILDLEELNII